MNIYEPMCGDSLSSAVRVLCRFIPCRMEFNGIELRSRTGSTPNTLMADFERQWQERARQYSESPEGIAAAQRDLEEIAAAQEAVDALTAELGAMDLTTASDALRWLERFQDPADRVGVRKDTARIIAAFESAGWARNDCVGHPDVASDSGVFARWLVGQALATIERWGAPHPTFHHFIEQWRKMA